MDEKQYQQAMRKLIQSESATGPEAILRSREERELGLNPATYTQKPWNPNDYIRNGMGKIASEMKAKSPNIVESQKKILGGVYGDRLSEKESQDIKATMMRRLEGEAGPELDSSFGPSQKEALRQLGVEIRNGFPVLDSADEEALNRTMDLEDHELTPRERLLLKAMTE